MHHVGGEGVSRGSAVPERWCEVAMAHRGRSSGACTCEYMTRAMWAIYIYTHTMQIVDNRAAIAIQGCWRAHFARVFVRSKLELYTRVALILQCAERRRKAIKLRWRLWRHMLMEKYARVRIGLWRYAHI